MFFLTKNSKFRDDQRTHPDTHTHTHTIETVCRKKRAVLWLHLVVTHSPVTSLRCGGPTGAALSDAAAPSLLPGFPATAYGPVAAAVAAARGSGRGARGRRGYMAYSQNAGKRSVGILCGWRSLHAVFTSRLSALSHTHLAHTGGTAREKRRWMRFSPISLYSFVVPPIASVPLL